MRVEIIVLPASYQLVFNCESDSNLTFGTIANLVEEYEGIPVQYIQFREVKNQNMIKLTELVAKYVVNEELKIAMMYSSLSGSCSCFLKRG